MIAHLSEGIPRHWLIDQRVCSRRSLGNELEYGLRTCRRGEGARRRERHVGDPEPGLRDPSVLTTLRKGITKLEVAGYTAAAFVLHPTDFEAVELALSSVNAIEHQGLPYDPAARRLYGVPVTTSLAQAAGVGHVIASGSFGFWMPHPWRRRPVVGERDRGLVRQEPCVRPLRVTLCDKSILSLGIVSLDLTP